MATAAPTTPLYARADAASTNEPPPAAHCPGGTNEPLAQLGASHLLVNTARSNEPNPHLVPENPSREIAPDVHPHLDTDRAPLQLRIVCSSGGNETPKASPGDRLSVPTHVLEQYRQPLFTQVISRKQYSCGGSRCRGGLMRPSPRM
jgi:hypothetical protein